MNGNQRDKRKSCNVYTSLLFVLNVVGLILKLKKRTRNFISYDCLKLKRSGVKG